MTTPVTIEDIYKLFQKSQEERDRRFAEIDRRAAEADRRFAERDRHAAEAKAESDRRAAEAKIETERRAAEAKIEVERRVAEAKIEEERSAAEAERRAAESARSDAEDKRRAKEINLQLKELGKQIGGLGAKFGSFTEGLALPSMEKILGDLFGMEVISPSVRVSKAGQHLEIDVLAYANSEINKAYVVEVKSHPREESITQLKSILEKFRIFFPEHKDKQVYGILAAVDLSANIRDKILQEGLYVARISDQTFEMDIPDDFCPKTW